MHNKCKKRWTIHPYYKNFIYFSICTPIHNYCLFFVV